MKHFRFLTLIILCFSGLSFGQETVGDSLSHYNLNQLYIKQTNSEANSDYLKAKIYGKEFLRKAKQKNDPLVIALGYELLALTYKNQKAEISLTYLDSGITKYSNETPNKIYPSKLYMLKADYLEYSGEIEKALDNYFKAASLAKKTGNRDFYYYISHNIGLIKKKLKAYNQSKEIFKNCLEYESEKKIMKKADSLSYLMSLSELINSFHLSKQIDSVNTYINEGLSLSKGKSINSLFKIHKGIELFHKNQFKDAKTSIDDGLNELLNYEDDYFYETDDLIYANTYLGKLNQELSLPNQAKENFRITDSLVKSTPNFDPFVRTAYLDLIDYSKRIDNKDLQLETSDKLLYVDSIINANYHFVSNKILYDYDTPNLIADKEEQIDNLNSEKVKTTYWLFFLGALLTLALVLLVYNQKKQRLYKKRFEALISSDDSSKIVSKDKQKINVIEANKPDKITLNIAPNVIDSIKEHLNAFEQTEGFLEKQITTTSLASKFNTNTKYLSKVIRVYKEKSFVNYINDLRIDYFMNKVQIDSKFRRYTIKALAQECGFNTTEAFSKTFYKKTGIYPSFYIKQIEKQVIT